MEPTGAATCKTRLLRSHLRLAYLAGVHLLLVLVLVIGDFRDLLPDWLGLTSARQEPTEYYQELRRHHARMDQTVPANSVIFIGDSIVQGLAVAAVTNPSANFGIGGDTTQGVLDRLGDLSSLAEARAVIVAVGINDMKYYSNEEIVLNLRKIAAAIPGQAPVIFCAILPIDEALFDGNNQRIRALNAEIRQFVAQDARLSFVDAGPELTDASGMLANTRHEGDGIHLDADGYAILVRKLQQVLAPTDTDNDVE